MRLQDYHEWMRTGHAPRGTADSSPLLCLNEPRIAQRGTTAMLTKSYFGTDQASRAHDLREENYPRRQRRRPHLLRNGRETEFAGPGEANREKKPAGAHSPAGFAVTNGRARRGEYRGREETLPRACRGLLGRATHPTRRAPRDSARPRRISDHAMALCLTPRAVSPLSNGGTKCASARALRPWRDCARPETAAYPARR